jgi:hypothetical protein
MAQASMAESPPCSRLYNGSCAVNDKARVLTVEEAKTKARECREMAKRSALDSHRIMLEHMAETWDRIVGEMPHANGM